MAEKKKQKHFNIRTKKGFQITFDNGVILSTQFGWGNYCENWDAEMPEVCKGAIPGKGHIVEPGWESDDAEVAIIGPDGGWLTLAYKPDNGDDVLYRVKFGEWLKIFDWCRNWKKESDHG